MRNSIVSPILLKQLIHDRSNFKLLYPVLSRRSLTPQEQIKTNLETQIDQTQQLVNLYDLSEIKQPIPYKLLNRINFDQLKHSISLQEDQKIIIFDRTIYLSCRLWWILRHYGFQDVAILDGGYANWKQQSNHQQPLERMNESPHQIKEQNIIQFDKIQDLDHNKTELIDARPSQLFQLGSIKKAKNIFWEEFLDQNKCFKTQLEIEQIFKDNLIDLDKQIITTCQTGKTATVINMALQLIGRNSYLYDGSYLEFSTKVVI